MTQYLVHEDSCRARGGRVTKKMVSGRNRVALSVQAWAHDPCFPGPPPASGSASPPWDREAGSLPQPPLPRSQPGHHLYWSWERRFGVHTPCPMARAAVDQPVGSLEASMASHDDTTEWAAGVPQLLRGGGLLFGDWHLHFRKISSVGASEAAQASQPTPVLGTRGWCLQAGCHAHSAQAPSCWAEPHGHQERLWPLHTWLTPTGV